MEHINREWDEHGICRNGIDPANLDPREPGLADLIRRAKSLGP
jgi:hypothetical protein